MRDLGVSVERCPDQRRALIVIDRIGFRSALQQQLHYTAESPFCREVQTCRSGAPLVWITAILQKVRYGGFIVSRNRFY